MTPGLDVGSSCFGPGLRWTAWTMRLLTGHSMTLRQSA